MLNQAHFWLCDIGRMDLRLALGSTPMFFISPLLLIRQRIQSYPLKAREYFLCTIQVQQERWYGHKIAFTRKFIMYSWGTNIYGKLLSFGRLCSMFWSHSDSPVKSTFHTNSLKMRSIYAWETLAICRIVHIHLLFTVWSCEQTWNAFVQKLIHW